MQYIFCSIFYGNTLLHQSFKIYNNTCNAIYSNTFQVCLKGMLLMILSVLFFHAVAVLFGAAFFEYDFGDFYFIFKY